MPPSNPNPQPGQSDTNPSVRPDFPGALDPLFVHARREVKVMLGIFVVFGLWVVGFSWIAGRGTDGGAQAAGTLLGMPGWVFWGVALPWILANLATFWFCFKFMAEDPLDAVPEESAPVDRPDAGPMTGSEETHA